TNYNDINPVSGSEYQVAPVLNGVEGEKSPAVKALDDNFFDIPLQIPEGGTIQGEDYTYSANDASAADLDGDGDYEIILKWDPSNAKDSATTGFTGPCIIDAYKTDGTLMWRINLGPNIRAGAHDTQFMVYDFDGDGKAEIAMKTADGTIDGTGKVIGDEKANWAVPGNGKNLTGPLFLTVFDGVTGAEIDSTEYDPQTTEKGAEIFGDGYGNRSERYLAAVAYLDGVNPSMVFCRGYYPGKDAGPGRTVIAAFDLKDGKLEKKWRFDTLDDGNAQYIGQGNHSMSVADVDFDGCDEIIYGALNIDHDGKPMYTTLLGHGDAQHVGDLIPSRPGLEIYSVHEDTAVDYGYEMRDARTGEILFGERTGSDNGRGVSGDIDPNYPGAESWSAGKMVSSDGTIIYENPSAAQNFLIYWDADLGREIQDNIYISKWIPEKNKTQTIYTASGCVSINGTKAVPSLTADLFGDFREETILPLKDSSALRVFTTTTPTSYRIPTLMHDIQYRMHVALQNVAYNQPTHTSYYLGFDTETVPVPLMYTEKDGQKFENPDLGKKSWNINDLYEGTSLQLGLDVPKALVNGELKRIDNDNDDVSPYLAEGNRTLVPLRFISESFGAEVDWDADTKGITITLGDKVIKMTAGSADYTVDGAQKTLDVPAEITNDRTFVPLRAVAENLGKTVFWDGTGLIVISDKAVEMSQEASQAALDSLKAAPMPAPVVAVAIIPSSKLYENQLDIFAVEASDNDGNNEAGAVDGDPETRWSAFGPNTLTLDLGSVQESSGVAIAMWKGDERLFTFSIEASEDGTNWTTVLENAVNSGTSTEAEKFDFKEKVKARYIRYSGEGDNVKGYCHISEIVVLK
ncbi:MAG: discoidin domain-containing protein, partial [Oscillospiraceae bacterium]|nr:discoidin domain-containing protein [Oscillospiraceae bacterium]